MDQKQEAKFKKGRGAQLEAGNRFESRQYYSDPEYREHLYQSNEGAAENEATSYQKIYPKSILNRVNSPDVGHNWSMNPYQGCEHGCAYCYARNSHEYWGYNASTDFEQKILVKENAAALLEQALQKKSWQPEPIVLSGNTDCYQPIERELRITRSLLEVCLEYRQPVGIITKNALIARDEDIIGEMAEKELVHAAFSITTLDEKLRLKLEPRTASAKKKLMVMKRFADLNIPVSVMIAPVIPGLNSHEVFDIARAAAESGALKAGYTMARLNGLISEIFLDWLDHHYPERAEKVASLIKQTHGGRLNDSDFGRRMRGEGAVAEQVKNMVHLARKRFFKGRKVPEYNTRDFVRAPRGQMSLFK